MALTVPYTIRLVNELRPYKVKWIEEYLPPDDYSGLEAIREALRGSPILLTTGEHEYTRYGFRQLIDKGSVDIVQPDITWLGGLTEARRVVALASAHDVLVIPHGSSVYAYHLQYAFPNCPLAEFINLYPDATSIAPYFGNLFLDEPLPKDGVIILPDKPGFGVTLNRDIIHRPYKRTEEESLLQAKKNQQPLESLKAILPF